MAALELGFLAERAGPASRPLIEREFQRSLEGRLEGFDAGQARRDQFGDPAGSAPVMSEVQVRIGPSASSTTAPTERRLAGEIAIGRGARNAGCLGDLADGGRAALLHQPDRGLQHQPAGAGTGTGKGDAGSGACGVFRAGIRLT